MKQPFLPLEHTCIVFGARSRLLLQCYCSQYWARGGGVGVGGGGVTTLSVALISHYYIVPHTMSEETNYVCVGTEHVTI